jgi:hypothetical protein
MQEQDKTVRAMTRAEASLLIDRVFGTTRFELG